MTQYCHFCGAELYKTSYGRSYCPNCGIVEENTDDTNHTNHKGDSNYIG